MSHDLRSLQPRLQIPTPVPAFGFRFLASDSRLFVLDSLLPVAGPGYCQRLTAMWALASLPPCFRLSVPRLLFLDYWSSIIGFPGYCPPDCWLFRFAVPELLVPRLLVPPVCRPRVTGPGYCRSRLLAPGQSSGPDSRGCPTSNPRECIHSTVAGSTRSLRSVQRRSSI